MKKQIILCMVLLLAVYLLQGFNLVAVTATVSTLLFCARKIGYFCKISVLAGIELAGVFLYCVWQILFKDMNVWLLALTVVVRLVFMAVVYYEIHNYIYVKKVIKKR